MAPSSFMANLMTSTGAKNNDLFGPRGVGPGLGVGPASTGAAAGRGGLPHTVGGVGMPGLSGLGFPGVNTMDSSPMKFSLPFVGGVPVARQTPVKAAATANNSSVTSSPNSTGTQSSSSSPWNDNEKMQDFFLHMNDPKQTAQHVDENNDKLINIRELIASQSAANNSKPKSAGLPKNPLAEMLAQRQGSVMGSPILGPASTTGDPKPMPKQQLKIGRIGSSSSMLTDMFSKRMAPEPQDEDEKPAINEKDEMTVRPHPIQPPQQANNNQKEQEKRPKNALEEMMMRRQGQAPQSSSSSSPKQAETAPTQNALSSMLMARRAPPPTAEKESTTQKLEKEVPLKEHPTYVQYFKMLKIGHPRAVVEHKMRQDGQDPAVLGFDPEKPLPKMQAVSAAAAGSDKPTAEEEAAHQAIMAEYNEKMPKYRQMLKVGLPRPIVEHKMRQEGVEASWLDAPPKMVRKAPVAAVPAAPTEEQIAAHREKYGKYFKMLRMGLPRGSVEHKMRTEGVDPKELDGPHITPAPVAAAAPTEAQIAAHKEKYAKYFKMLRMGLPRGSVEHKMRTDGFDPKELDGPHVAAAPTAAPAAPTAAQIAAHKEKYAKYFKMLSLGLPRGSVEHKMRTDGIDPKELDGPQVAAPAAAPAMSPTKPPLKRINSIRKKLHWDVKKHNPVQLQHRDSLWSVSTSRESLEELHISISDESKSLLEKLFVKTVDPSKKRNLPPKGPAGSNSPDKKKAMIVLIDMKKSQNIAITLARVKMGFPELKREILTMNPTVLSSAQLQSLMDMWPDTQEQQAIDAFHGDINDLGTTEKFLVETRNVPRFRERLSCLVFKQDFPSRTHELRESMNLVIRCVEQVCSSEGLRQIFIYILQIGNLLNYGEDDDRAADIEGFSLASLVKLSQTKAFVGGTTFLHYIVQSIERDVPSLARFYDQIKLISKASKVSFNALASEKKALENGLKALERESKMALPPSADEDLTLATSILTHFASEVESDLEALDELSEQVAESKTRFLEYFEEEDTGEELDVLMGHIANFIDDYRREYEKYLRTKPKDKPKPKEKPKEKESNQDSHRHSQHRHSNHRHHSGADKSHGGGAPSA